MTNWAEIYRSLQIDTLKYTGTWMLLTGTVAGLIIMFFFFLIFKEQPFIVYGIGAVGLLIFFYYQIRLIRLYKKPIVYTGIVYDKFVKRHSNDINGTETVKFFVRMGVDSSFEFDKNGDIMNFDNLPFHTLLNCPSHLFEKLMTGNEISLVVMSHNNTIAHIV